MLRLNARNTATVLGEDTHVLVHFPVDDTTSIVRMSSVIPLDGGKELAVGDMCHVKEMKKIHEGRVLEIGNKKKLIVLEDAFLKEDEDENESEEKGCSSINYESAEKDHEMKDTTVPVTSPKLSPKKRKQSSQKKTRSISSSQFKPPKKKQKTDKEKTKGSILLVSDYQEKNSDSTSIVPADTVAGGVGDKGVSSQGTSQKEITLSSCESGSLSLALNIEIDELEMRVVRIEGKLDDAIERIARLEKGGARSDLDQYLLTRNQLSYQEQIIHQQTQFKNNQETIPKINEGSCTYVEHTGQQKMLFNNDQEATPQYPKIDSHHKTSYYGRNNNQQQPIMNNQAIVATPGPGYQHLSGSSSYSHQQNVHVSFQTPPSTNPGHDRNPYSSRNPDYQQVNSTPYSSCFQPNHHSPPIFQYAGVGRYNQPILPRSPIEILSDDDDVPPLPEQIFISGNSDSMKASSTYKPGQYLQPKQLDSSYSFEKENIGPVHNNQVPRCFPIEGKSRKDQQLCLSSYEIDKSSLIPPDNVIAKNKQLHKEAVVGKLAVKLARSSFFGDDVLKKCTVMGCRNIPALPLKELNELKQLLFSLFPQYWKFPAEFETVIWNQCTNSLGQLCKRLRSQ